MLGTDEARHVNFDRPTEIQWC